MSIKVGSKYKMSHGTVKIACITNMDESGNTYSGDERIAVCEIVEGMQYFEVYDCDDEKVNPDLKNGTIGFSVSTIKKYGKLL